MEEIWKEVNNYSGLYEVSNYGKVRNARNKKILSQSEKIDPAKNPNNRYMTVSLGKNKKWKRVSVHILVAEAFILNPENKPEVNHKDNIKKNNFADNLEWSTGSENVQHAFDNGFRDTKGNEKHGYRKLKPMDRIAIKQKYISGIYTRSTLAKEFNISLGRIDQILYLKSIVA